MGKQMISLQENHVSPKPDSFALSKPPMIMGVRTRALKPIADERGHLMEIFRSDWPEFTKFGQTYMTAGYPGAVKAWHYHKRQIDHFVCVAGVMKVVLYDPRKSSKTYGVVNEFFLGDYSPLMLEIPPLVYHGFKCVSTEPGIIVNVTNELYDYKNPDEYRLPAHTKKIPYDWARKDG